MFVDRDVDAGDLSLAALGAVLDELFGGLLRARLGPDLPARVTSTKTASAVLPSVVPTIAAASSPVAMPRRSSIDRPIFSWLLSHLSSSWRCKSSVNGCITGSLSNWWSCVFSQLFASSGTLATEK